MSTSGRQLVGAIVMSRQIPVAREFQVVAPIAFGRAAFTIGRHGWRFTNDIGFQNRDGRIYPYGADVGGAETWRGD